MKRFWLACSVIFCMSFFVQQRTAYADTFSGSAVYTPSNPAVDPWEGGTLVLRNDYQVHNNEITYNPLLSRTVDFDIVWEAPEGVSPQAFLNALTTNSSITIGSQKVLLSKNDFKIWGNQIVYTFSERGFDFIALLRWLAALVINPEVTISTQLSFDVNLLSNNVLTDTSVNKIVTRGKLPPSNQQVLFFKSGFYNRRDEYKGDATSRVNTWHTYISPWNEVQANSALNGKSDDTQQNGSLEVLNSTRVLNGQDYRNRLVKLPITEEIQPALYVRTVNLFAKQATDSSGVIVDTLPVEKSMTQDENGAQRLRRQSTFRFSGNGLSPVNMQFVQETALHLTLVQSTIETTVDTPVKLTGTLATEGKENRFYYRIAGKNNQTLPTVNQATDQLSLTIPSLPEGSYQLVVGVTNEFGLTQETSLDVKVFKEELSLTHVPDVMQFGTHTIPKPGDKFYNELPFVVDVLDTYREKLQWKLSVALMTPFQTKAGDLLPADLFIENQAQEKLRITKDFTDLYVNNSVTHGQKTPVSFKENEGVFLQMNSANVKVNTEYQGTVQFLLQKGP